jgi:hypothetical protein
MRRFFISRTFADNRVVLALAESPRTAHMIRLETVRDTIPDPD